MFLQNITEQQIQQFRQAFALFDKDGDGCINNKVTNIITTLSPSIYSNSKQSFVHQDTTQPKNNCKSLHQSLMRIEAAPQISDNFLFSSHSIYCFIEIINSHRRLNDKTLFDEIVESFKVMDKDNDGCLTRIEIMEILREQEKESMVSRPGKQSQQKSSQYQNKGFLKEIFDWIWCSGDKNKVNQNNDDSQSENNNTIGSRSYNRASGTIQSNLLKNKSTNQWEKILTILDELDINNEGLIDIADFVNYLVRNQEVITVGNQNENLSYFNKGNRNFEQFKKQHEN